MDGVECYPMLSFHNLMNAVNGYSTDGVNRYPMVLTHEC